MRYLTLVLLLSTPAKAQEWIDFDLVMQQSADQVVMTTDANGQTVRTLDMGDGVIVNCDPDGCTGTETVSEFAVGCAFSIYAEVAAFAQVCKVPLTAEQAAVVEGAFRDVGAFVAGNAVPPRPADYPAEFLARRIAAMSAEFAAAPTDICLDPFETDYGMMLGALALDLDPEALREGLSVPRLPVMNPCL